VLRVSLVNTAQTTVTNSFTRIALAPRQRDYGKINVNTVMNSEELGSENVPSSNVLSALPGLLQQWDGMRLIPSPDSTDPAIRDRARARARDIVELRELEELWAEPYTSVGDLLNKLAWVSVSGNPDPVPWRDALDNSSATPGARLNETLERFKHISNLVTVRSDVFEIICIAQAGQYFGGEFVPVGEKKIRVVYER
jgi:hypothetical protein